MAEALTSFTVEHASGLHAVARRLDEIHRNAIKFGSADEDTPAVRVSVVNLVAVCTSVDEADIASQVAGVVSQTHPTRAIIVTADPAAPDNIEADLSFQRGSAADGLVSAEQVRLTVSGEAALHLASVVTPLLVPDIPVYLWLVGNPPLRRVFGDDAIAIAERIVIDSGQYTNAVSVLEAVSIELGADSHPVGLADMAWSRSRVWRETLAQAFDGQEMRAFVHNVTRVEIESAGLRPSTEAWLCIGWLAERLQWQVSASSPEIVATSRFVDDVGEHELIAVRVTSATEEHHATVVLTRDDDMLMITIEIDGGIRASRTAALRLGDAAHSVANLLEEPHDPLYVGAVRKAADFAKSLAS